MQQAQTTNPHDLVKQAIATCNAFCEHLDFENKALEEQDIATVEEATKTKRHLGAKLETLLKDVRTEREAIKANAGAMTELQNLQVAIDNYQSKARKNVVMLSAAHEATAQFLGMVRQAVMKLKPKATTYGKQGEMTDHGVGSTSLLNKNI